MINFRVISCKIFLSFVCILFSFFIVLSVYFVSSPIIKKNDFHYILKPGTYAKVLAYDLYKKADLKYPKLFLLLTKIRKIDQRLKAGEYIFPAGIKPNGLLNQIFDEKILYHKFTIVEGYTCKDLIKSLNNSNEVIHTLNNSSPEVISEKLGISHKNPEGLFLPDTYYYTLGTTDLELLKRAYIAMEKYIRKEWDLRNKNLKYKNSYEALIVASMIEKETSIKEEKPIIADVILKRWNQWIPLQIDATVVYGLGDTFCVKLTKKDLSFKTPYNTYTKYGLPPTPISMAGKDSIKAALHPFKTRVLYFVAKSDGTHEFSASLSEHHKVISKIKKE